MHLLKMLLRCINGVGCVKKRHPPRCIHKMQAILSVFIILTSTSKVMSFQSGVIQTYNLNKEWYKRQNWLISKTYSYNTQFMKWTKTNTYLKVTSGPSGYSSPKYLNPCTANGSGCWCLINCVQCTLFLKQTFDACNSKSRANFEKLTTAMK